MTDRARPHPPTPGPDAKRALLARLVREHGGPGDPLARPWYRLFEARARQTPDAPAVGAGGGVLTYAALNARSNRLARHLRALGVGPEVRVGLCVGRGPEMVVALLGVLKAGGAYVPLDPAFPAARLAFMMDDAKAPVLVTESALADRPGPHDATTVLLDADADAIAARPGDDLPGGPSGENLAYVIYTSGSTGRPKGVMVPHRALTNFLLSMARRPGLTARDVLLAVTTLSFDIAALELFLPLVVGARVEVAGREEAADGARLAALLRGSGASVMQATPASWRLLLESGWEGGPGLTVLCGGEPMTRDLADRLLERAGAVWNLYGPTETTVWSTAAKVEPGAGPVPVGRPIANTRAYVLDARLRPVPIGLTGELYLGGAGLARGYHDRPGLTAERFVADPYAKAPGARMYRTGDLARYREDGVLECLGRLDGQVKVRGFRIELGEVEAALAAHPALAGAAAAARDESTGEKRLVGYYVPRGGGGGPGEADLRGWLRDRLPAYMVPSAFVALDALPMTPNGKVDRKALPDPADAGVGSAARYVAPRTGLEEIVASTWEGVLGREPVGAFDDFFELGGHSLLAAQVVARLREALGFEVPLRALFEAPTVAGLAAWVDAARHVGDAEAAAPIPPAPRDRPLPASFAQEALWFLDRLDPGRPTFHMPVPVRVRGPLDVAALDRAFAAIVRRHEALRTTFAVEDGVPVQHIRDGGGAALDVVDLTDLPEPDREAEARRRVAAEVRRPFDLERGPLARGLVLRLGDRDHAVALTLHHIVGDGWSLNVAGRELAALYEAFRQGQPSPLPPLPVQYPDYALWQRGRLAGGRLRRLLDYWTGRLAGVPPLELPTDRPRPAVRSARGGEHAFRIPGPLAAAVRTLARREGATPFMVLLAAFQAVLARHSGQSDFAVGTPVANRGRAELEPLIGYFINMLALRADLSGGPTFRELLRRVRSEALGGFEHQELPLERVVEALHPGRDLSRTPLFQAMFVFQNNETPDASRADLAVEGMAVEGGTGAAKFDLTLAVSDARPEMAAALEYDADLFDAATVERFAGHFLTLLAAATADPGAAVEALPLLSDGERRLVVETWNATRTDGPAPAWVHRAFEAQAARTPGATAVEWDGGRLPYAALDRQANRLAHRLRALGVGPGVRVAIAAERSPGVAAALLGVLKAGGAFVPLDPAYPAERLAFMLDDARPAVLLVPEALRDQFPRGEAVVVGLDEPLDDWPATDPGVAVEADDPAYVLYTSGSTGVPRGAVVAHGGLANHARAAADLFGLSPADRVLQFASLSFDIAVEELFPAWSRGATVVLRGGDETLEPSRFARWIADRSVGVLDLPTAYWHAWVNDLAARGEALPPCLRLVVVGGERALATVLEKWRSIGGDRVRWVNTYGPTETTVIATAHEPAGPEAGEVPIGRPIANVRAYVLDPGLRPAPVGVAGELYVGGAGVGPGYLNRPDLTAERFVADPFAPGPGARLFRTGDRARWRGDGVLEFLGRCDEQVKVRGYRVEPGEVEAALLRHPGVRAAAVAAGAEPGGGTRLNAYVVPHHGGAAPADALRRFLRATLPAPAVPATFTALDGLPMTPSGKVDRRALPPPDESTAGRAGAAEPPRDDLEARLARLWEEVLGVAPVGVTDGFFDLGGHSLLAIRLLARVEEAFGRRLDLPALFLGPTVADQAALLRAPAPGAGTGDWSPLVPVRAGGDRPPFFCVHPAGGIVYCFSALARALGDDQPFYALQAAGLDGRRSPAASIEEMAGSYLQAIREVRPEGPYHLGGWSLGGLVAFEMARRLRDAGEEVGTVALLDSRAPAAAPPVVGEALAEVARQVAALEILGPPGPDDDPEVDALVLAEFAGELGAESGDDAPRLLAHLRGLDPEARRAHVLRVFRLDEVYHLETGPERVRRLLAVLRASLRAAARYAPGPYDGRLLVARAEAGNGRAGDPALGWSRLARGGVEAFGLDADHEGILQEPAVSLLAARLREAIAGPAGRPADRGRRAAARLVGSGPGVRS